MSSTPPFDQDEPRRTAPSSPERRQRRDRRPTGPDADRGPRADGRRRSPDRPRPANGGEGALAGLPRWAVPAGVGFLVVVVLLIVLKSCSGGGSREDAGACLTDLASRLPAAATAVHGTDFVQASRAGWDLDGSLEDIGAARAETGVIPDPVTRLFRINPLATPEQFEARTGMGPSDVECSLSDGTRSVLSGSFDPPAVNGSQAGADGDLAANEDLLAMDIGRGDPKVLLEPATDDGLAGDDAFVAVLESLRDAGAYTVLVQRGDGEDGRALAAGIGAGGTGDDRTVLVAWSFDGEDDAKAGRPEIVNRVNAVLKGTVSITAADLTVDGSEVTATIPTRGAPDLQDLTDRDIRFVDAPA